MPEGLNKGENKKIDESILEDSRAKTAQMFLGDNYKKLADVGAGDLANKIGQDFESIQRMKTMSLEINDVYVNEKDGIAAVLLEEHSWGGGGGIQWDKDLKIQIKELQSRLQILEVRHRFNKQDDMPEFEYTKIKEIKSEGDCFYVQFEGDEKLWKIKHGQEYLVKRSEELYDIGPNKKIEVYQDEIELYYSTPDGRDRKILNSKREEEEFIQDMRKKYGDSFKYNTHHNEKRICSAYDLRVNVD